MSSGIASKHPAPSVCCQPLALLRLAWHGRLVLCGMPSCICAMPSPGRVAHPGVGSRGMGFLLRAIRGCRLVLLGQGWMGKGGCRGYRCPVVPAVSWPHLSQALLPHSSLLPTGAEPGQPEKCWAAPGAPERRRLLPGEGEERDAGKQHSLGKTH